MILLYRRLPNRLKVSFPIISSRYVSVFTPIDRLLLVLAFRFPKGWALHGR